MKKAISNEEFIASLKANPAYSHVDIEIEMRKADAWCMVNRRQNTPRFFVNWLNRIDRPLVPARRHDPGRRDPAAVIDDRPEPPCTVCGDTYCLKH